MTQERVSDEKLAEIIAGCEGVTPGPYRVRHHPINEDMFFVEAPPHPGSRHGIEIMGEDTGDSFYPLKQKKADAAHISRLDPYTVRSLMTELQHLRSQDAGGWRDMRSAPSTGKIILAFTDTVLGETIYSYKIAEWEDWDEPCWVDGDGMPIHDVPVAWAPFQPLVVSVSPTMEPTNAQ